MEAISLTSCALIFVGFGVAIIGQIILEWPSGHAPDARARRKILLACSNLIGMVSLSVFLQSSNTSETSHDGVSF